ncbi:hypothetical protein KQH82_07845 [bacterium]|nr:hypothetical protein [bacterium]
MNDELNKIPESSNPATVAAEAETPAPAKGGFPKMYLLFGVIGILVVALAIVSTMLLMGGDETAVEPAATETHETAPAEESQADHTEPAESHAQSTTDEVPDIPDFEPFEPPDIEEDSGVLGDIMANLEFLDYAPTMPAEEEVPGESSGMSKEDSIDAARWFESETKRLELKEKELNARQRELEILDKKVSQKIVRIEQAESARVAALARLYDGMDPRSVAKLVANLDDGTVVSILPRMKQKNASQVLALMPAVRAAKLSKQMITIAEN